MGPKVTTVLTEAQLSAESRHFLIGAVVLLLFLLLGGLAIWLALHQIEDETARRVWTGIALGTYIVLILFFTLRSYMNGNLVVGSGKNSKGVMRA